MDLRDPIWQGFEALITIAGVIFTVVFFIVPEAREWLLKTVRSFRLGFTISALTLCICVVLSIPLTKAGVLWAAQPTSTNTAIPLPTLFPTHTPNPVTATPAYTYLIFNDFNSGIPSDWQIISGQWQMVNNRLTIIDVQNGANWSKGRIMTGSQTWTNYEVGMDVHLVNVETKINAAYVIVRAINDNNYLLLEIRDFDLLDADWSRGRWYVVSNDILTEIPNAGFSSFLTTDFSINIQLQNDIVTTFIDGNQVSRWGGAPYPNGRVGLEIASRYPTDPTAFDNFYIRTQP